MALLLLPAKVNMIVPTGQQNTTWGLILMIGAIEATVGPALMGWLSDRTSTKWGRRRPFIAAGAILTCVACAVLGTAQSVPALIVGYLLLQIADDVGTGPYSAVIPENVPAVFRGRASGVLGMLNFSAQVIAAICVILGVSFGIDHLLLFALIGVLHLVGLAIVWTTVKETPYPERTARPLNLEVWISPWRSPNFRWVWFTRFLTALGFYILSSFGQNYLKDVVRVFDPVPIPNRDPVQGALLAATLVIVIISFCAVFGALIGGRLADRVGRQRVIQVAGVIMFCAMFPLSQAPAYAIILGIALIFGVGYGAYSSADWALAADVLPDQQDVAKDMGIWQSSIALPQVFQGFFGAQVDRMNLAQPNSGYTTIFIISAFLFLAGSLLVSFVKTSRPGVASTPRPAEESSA